MMSDKFFDNFCPYSIKFSPDASKIVCGSTDYILSLWDTESGKFVKYFSKSRYHHRYPGNILFSKDGKTICSGGGASPATISLWNVESGQEVSDIEVLTDFTIVNSYSADGTLLISSEAEGVMKVWNISEREEYRTFTGNSEAATEAVFSPGNDFIYSFSDYVIRKWDTATGVELQKTMTIQFI